MFFKVFWFSQKGSSGPFKKYVTSLSLILWSIWSGVITTFKVVLMRLLKRYFFEVVTSLFSLTPFPTCHYFGPKGVPNTWTKYFQPSDLSSNRSSKSHLRNSEQTWYSSKIQLQIFCRKLPYKIKADTRISVIKPLRAKWIVQFYDYIRSYPNLRKI